jgi:hypothetical protein
MYHVPEYLDFTFGPRDDGFMFSVPPPAGISETKYLRDNNPWVVVACALARLREGDFSNFVPLIEALQRYDDIILALGIGALFAHAAPLSVTPLLERVYTHEALLRYPEMVRQYCEILCHSMRPGYLNIVLYWYGQTDNMDVRESVPLYLSSVWEDEPSVIEEGPQLVLDPQYPPPFEQYVHDYVGYERQVRETASRVDPSASYVLGGAPFSVVALAKRMLTHARAGEDSPRTNFERMVFEANTGISCRGFFADDESAKFRPLAAMAILEDFLADPWSRHFVDGQRYFFGHPIPD